VTLKEALESGKPFRRAGTGWLVEQTKYFTRDQILSTDWEVKQEPREWWLVSYPDTGSAAAFAHKHEAEKHARYHQLIEPLTHVREVLP
jgi:hypothetical protein